MKPFLIAVAVATPTVAALLYFSLQGREEVKATQEEARIEQKIDAAKFDQDFAAAWNGGGKLKAPGAAEIAALEAEREEIKAKKALKDIEVQEDFSDLRAALQESTTGASK